MLYGFLSGTANLYSAFDMLLKVLEAGGDQ
jgi:hypothetical protein